MTFGTPEWFGLQNIGPCLLYSPAFLVENHVNPWLFGLGPLQYREILKGVSLYHGELWDFLLKEDKPRGFSGFRLRREIEAFWCHQVYCQKHFVSPKTIGTMIDVLPERIEEFQMSSTRSPKFNMVHLKMIPWIRRFHLETIIFRWIMLIFGGVLFCNFPNPFFLCGLNAQPFSCLLRSLLSEQWGKLSPLKETMEKPEEFQLNFWGHIFPRNYPKWLPKKFSFCWFHKKEVIPTCLILLMEEIPNNRLGCTHPCKSCDTLPTSTG